MKTSLTLLIIAVTTFSVSATIIPLDFDFGSWREKFQRPVIDFHPLPVYPTPIFPVPDDKNPCGHYDYCGEAVPFKSEKDLSAFVGKHCQNYFLYEARPILLTTNTAQLDSSQASFSANVQTQQMTADSLTSSQLKSSSVQSELSRDFSGTNNQQQTVDEADILKTDGDYIYSVSGNVLSIIRAYPAWKAKVESTINLDSAPSALFLSGNYLAVFGTVYNYQSNLRGDSLTKAYYYQPPTQHTYVHVYDISSKRYPQLIKEYEIEGRYTNGRMTQNGFVYLISTLSCSNRQSEKNPAPWYNFHGRKQHLSPNQIFHYPGSSEEYQGANFLSIFTFNLASPRYPQQKLVSVVGQSSHLIYMSEKNIYLAATRYLNNQQKTSIHKIFVWRNMIIPFADGVVEGTLNNQFSMDQHGGDLRVATTRRVTSNSRTETSSAVYCLDKYLNIVGTVENIAPGERIFSARYVDQRLYLVTFRQIDPFFVIDLSDHKKPQILGELKISGFSRYLHPYDANTIIGFGRDATDQGRQEGLKISLFDVTDVKRPTELVSYKIEEKFASSTAEWEHKAFLFSKDKNLMVIPGSLNDYQHPENSFNGAFVFDIQRNGRHASVSLRGIINHVLSKEDQFYQRRVERSLYIQDLLYTKSPCLIRINQLSSLKSVKNLPLECSYSQQIYPQPLPTPILVAEQTPQQIQTVSLSRAQHF